MLHVKKSYTFDDVLLIPKKSDITSRDEVDISVSWGKGIETKIPLVSANMKTVTGPEFATKMADLGGLAILHRFTDDRIADFNSANRSNVGVSVGIAESEKEFLKKLTSETNCKIVCVDIAHAHSKACIDFVDYVAATYPDLLLIAGNVATGLAAKHLADSGADVVKVGIGGGSICSTRDTTGNGVPQLTAISEVAYQLDAYPTTKIISDGGLKTSGNIVKALCFTDGVMLGTMLAGADEAPGRIVEIDGLRFKEYVGSSTYKQKYIEGITSRVACKGPLADMIETICDGIRSGCSYQGANNLKTLKLYPEFVEISNAGLVESKTHAVIK